MANRINPDDDVLVPTGEKRPVQNGEYFRGSTGEILRWSFEEITNDAYPIYRAVPASSVTVDGKTLVTPRRYTAMKSAMQGFWLVKSNGKLIHGTDSVLDQTEAEQIADILNAAHEREVGNG